MTLTDDQKKQILEFLESEGTRVKYGMLMVNFRIVNDELVLLETETKRSMNFTK